LSLADLGWDATFEDGWSRVSKPGLVPGRVTAGHTRGCTSWSFPVSDGGRELLAVDICSLTLNPLVPEAYPGIRSDFERSFRVLRSLPADIFLASHADMFSMQRKLGERADARSPVDPFIDRAGYLGFIDRAEERFRKALADQQR